MSLADFFRGLTLELIEALVTEQQEEHLSLEFKTVAGPELKSGSDKKNLAEVLSGFANSAGGVVIWGIATERASGNRDIASAKSANS